MHLNNRPIYFVKGSSRKAAYYTVQVRELLANGWVQEESVGTAAQSVETVTPEQPMEAVAPEQPAEDAAPEQPAESVASEQPAEQPSEQPEEGAKSLNEMTKTELVAYAEANGIEFKQYATKSEILEACQSAQNG